MANAITPDKISLQIYKALLLKVHNSVVLTDALNKALIDILNGIYVAQALNSQVARLKKIGYKWEAGLMVQLNTYYISFALVDPKPTNRRDILIDFINELVNVVKQ